MTELAPRRHELRMLSRLAFGQGYRLELMLEIADTEDGVFSLTELARSLDVTMSNLQRPLQDMLEMGLLSVLPDSGSRYRYYTSNPSPAWEWAFELAGVNRSSALRGGWKSPRGQIAAQTISSAE
jgi:DNA-binding transcriptional ArsR family regulator